MDLKCVIWTALLLVICRQGVVTAEEKKHIICYHGTWATYRQSLGKFDVSTDIEPTLCTHLMYAFFGIEESGNLRIIDPYLDLEENYGRGNIRQFNALKFKSPTLKTLAAVGGWNEGSRNFSIVAADPAKRAKFVQTSVQFIQRHGFDGLDLDWEYPNQRHKLANDDRRNFLLLIKELKEGLEPYGYILTAAVGSAKFSAALSYDIPEMVNYLDLINVMAYDLHGPWDPALGLNAPLYAGPGDVTDLAKQMNFDAIVRYWLSQGAPRDKLVMGVPFYGRSFTLQDENNHQIGAPHIGRGMPGQYSAEAGVIGYNELCEKLESEKSLWHVEWDNDQKGPYAYSGRNWISYDNEQSIALKVEYVKKEKLAGVMVWSLESDDFRGNCGSLRYPLLTKINEIFNSADTALTESTPDILLSQSNFFQCNGLEGYQRDPKDCGKFYFCDKDVAHTFECPATMFFDLNYLSCNYSQLVECQMLI